MARQASLLVADEIYYNLHGKAILQGIYNSDLTIPTSPSTAPQLLFFFMAETDLADPFKSLAAEIMLPESAPVRHQILVQYPVLSTLHEGRTKLFYRHPMLISAPQLRPGPIQAKVIHEEGEIVVGAPWITLLQSAPMPN